MDGDDLGDVFASLFTEDGVLFHSFGSRTLAVAVDWSTGRYL